jgi:hypothetical protein
MWKRQGWLAVLVSGPVMLGVAGCGGDARLELAAADALAAAAERMQTAVDEYHAEMAAFDDSREEAVTEAFVRRVRADAANEQALAAHSAEFKSALGRIREDRAVEQQRRGAAVENVGVVREVADGLRRMGVESLTLSDEMRRYLSGWIEARKQAVAAKAATAGKTVTACGPGKGCNRDSQ